MSTEENKALVRRSIEEGWNEGNLAVFDEIVAPDFINHDPAEPAVRTREDYKQWIAENRREFPDFHVTIEDMIAEGDKVVLRCTFYGTHTGDITTPMSIPATGKQVAVSSITIDRFAGGKAVEIWQLTDMLGFYQQIGVIPASGQAG
jgi:steroid delta-isomerase-like uncharacterized protein